MLQRPRRYAGAVVFCRGEARTHMLKRLTMAVVVSVVAACVPLKNTPSRQNVITQAEIDDSNARTAYDVVARYRGDFLRDRGPTSITLGTRDVATVFLNDVEYGPLASLHDVRAADIAEIDFFPGPDAVIKFGSQYGGGVIQLHSRYR